MICPYRDKQRIDSTVTKRVYEDGLEVETQHYTKTEYIEYECKEYECSAWDKKSDKCNYKGEQKTEEILNEIFEERLEEIEKSLKKGFEKNRNIKEINVILLSGIFDQLNLSNKIAIYNLKKEGK